MDKNIYGAETINNTVDQILHVLLLANICGNSHNFACRRVTLYLFNYGGNPPLIKIGQDNFSSSPGKLVTSCPANAAGSACYYNHLLLKSHKFPCIILCLALY
jgi:hypothetical protein